MFNKAHRRGLRVMHWGAYVAVIRRYVIGEHVEQATTQAIVVYCVRSGQNGAL